MFIDYIYLCLIILIICFIIFIIYLSYEYRNIEPFKAAPNINSIKNFKEQLGIISPKKLDFDNEYEALNKEVVNRYISRHNIKNINLHNKLENDSVNSKKLKELNEKIINKSQVNSFPIDKLIKTIKSKYNAQYLSTFSHNINNYGILVNDKCLSINGLCKEEFCLLECKNNLYKSDSQVFNTTRINSANDAAKYMNVPIDKISNKNIYPYNIFKSIINDNCLTISNDGITVEHCNLNNIKQQWEISPDENICVLE